MCTHLAEDASVDNSQDTDYSICRIHGKKWGLKSGVIVHLSLWQWAHHPCHSMTWAPARDWLTCLTEGLTFGCVQPEWTLPLCLHSSCHVAVEVTITILAFHFSSTVWKYSILTDAALNAKVQGSKIRASDTDIIWYQHARKSLRTT